MEGQLTYPLDKKSQEVLRKTLADSGFLRPLMFDLVWRNLQPWNTMLESPDGFSLNGTAPTFDDTGVTMTTAASLNSTSGLSKGAPLAGAFTFSKRSAFRLRATWNTGATANSETLFMLGPYTSNAGANADFYGFKATNTALAGVTCNVDTGTPSTTPLITLSEFPIEYELEARYEPGRAVVFYVDGEEKGYLSSTLPDPDTTIGQILDWEIKTTNTTAKAVWATGYDFLQDRYTNV